jgi:hypothetical protein
MTFHSKIRVRVLRNGSEIHGSPFLGRIYYTETSHTKRYANAPLAAKIRHSKVLSFDCGADILLGDLVATPDGSYQKVADVRRYGRSVQCDLLWLPYTALAYYTPLTIAASTNSMTFNVSDKVYTAQGTIKAYIEPQQAQMLAIEAGDIDTSVARAFTLKAISADDVIVNGDGSIWIARAHSAYYSETNDYIATMARLQIAPPGV